MTKGRKWFGGGTLLFGGVVLLLVSSGCRGSDAKPADSGKPVAGSRPDSASGEVAQYALMKNAVTWLTDSNLVSLATTVNQAPISLARIEAQLWSNAQIHAFALEVLRDHAALQGSIDSLAAKRRIPAQRPAVAESMQAPYDSIVASLAGLPLADMEPRFLAAMTGLHARTVTDFAAIAGNATDPDLKGLFANRAMQMEQLHASKAKLIAAALVRADSVRKDSVEKAQARRKRP
jgi:predicted outer membrane protein